ncbi:hypothetical protein NDU88_006287 [Pleurodeles waltl]|uniref:Uncharacterized protein n=1 Tax=Pleurodeles waltl TaxID=8319 RepID=A0AAV7LNP4_PLEWA|nr:hypothetical protein NDU88_006287 [Pleurodeles waltl]
MGYEVRRRPEVVGRGEVPCSGGRDRKKGTDGKVIYSLGDDHPGSSRDEGGRGEIRLRAEVAESRERGAKESGPEEIAVRYGCNEGVRRGEVPRTGDGDTEEMAREELKGTTSAMWGVVPLLPGENRNI